MKTYKMLRLGIVFFLSIITVIISLSGCEKENQESAVFDKGGGMMEYEKEIDGSSLFIRIDDKRSENADYQEDYREPNNNQWITDLDWVHVFYLPSSHRLFIIAEENTSGRKRKASVRANTEYGGEVHIHVVQR